MKFLTTAFAALHFLVIVVSRGMLDYLPVLPITTT
jgi:hypothetical protein